MNYYLSSLINGVFSLKDAKDFEDQIFELVDKNFLYSINLSLLEDQKYVRNTFHPEIDNIN